MAYNVISCQKVAENTQSLNSLCKSGSRPQKSPKKGQKTDHSIAIYSIFLIVMVYFKCFKVNPNVQTVQNMYGKGGKRVCKAKLWPLKVDPYFKREKNSRGGVPKSLQPGDQSAIWTLEPNPPERM